MPILPSNIFLLNFLKVPKPAEDGGEVDAETAEKIINTGIIPESVVFLNANDEFLKDRVKHLPEESLLDTHWNEEGMNRRLPLYRKLNEEGTGNPIVIDFFKENSIQPH